MGRRRRLATGALGRAVLWVALAGIGLAALFLVWLLSPGATDSAGPFPVDDKVAAFKIVYDGACDPGTLASDSPSIPAKGGIGTGLPIKLTGTVSKCIATECSPGTVLIDQELFSYSNVSAYTTWTIGSSPSYPLTFTVADIPRVIDPSTGAEICPAQDHMPNEFPSSGYIFVESELMYYSSRTDTSFTIASSKDRGKGGTTATKHQWGSLVRAQGLLKLEDRAQPRYVGGGSAALTAEAPHGPDARVTSPRVYLTCRALLLAPYGPSEAGSRSRCYAVLQPGYNLDLCDSSTLTDPDCYWPAPRYSGDLEIDPLMPVLPLLDSVYHDISTGTLTDLGASASLHLWTEYSGAECIPYITDLLSAKIETTIKLDKDFVERDPDTEGDLDYRTFTIWVYPSGDCSGDAIAGLTEVMGDNPDFPGNPYNLVSTQLRADWDTDGDGCPDKKELGDTQGSGGLRDPLNRYDYMNPTKDGINRTDDILAVVDQYRIDDPPGQPDYNSQTDRTYLGPNPWNVGPPNGLQRTDDILSAVDQYRHDCP